MARPMPTVNPSPVTVRRGYTFQQNQKLTALANFNIGGSAENLMLRNGGDDIFRQPISVVIAVTSRLPHPFLDLAAPLSVLIVPLGSLFLFISLDASSCMKFHSPTTLPLQ